MKEYDALIVGGGAAGLFAAGHLADAGLSVAIVEKNERPARKVMITGKGRCNLTNCCDSDSLISSLTKNSRFMYSAFGKFSSYDTMALFEDRLKVPLKVERGNRVFPVSDRAVDVVDALVEFAGKADMIHGRVTRILCSNGIVRGAELEDGRKINAGNVLIATGGASYPATGSTGDGYVLARAIGHRVINPTPSLVPVISGENFCRELMGLSLKNVEVKIVDRESGHTVFSDQGEMLFTHFGVSGPLILSGSAHMRPMTPGRFVISIDLKPALDEQQLSKRISRDFSENINREFRNSLGGLLPRKIIPVIVKLSGIAPDQKVNQITREQRTTLVHIIKNFTVTAKGFRPIEEAIVTSGGVDVDQINPGTMQSKLVKGLFFAGEVMDLDAYTGGFNLQIAFSTAYAAATGIINMTKEAKVK